MKYLHKTKNTFNYQSYYELTEKLVSEGKTTGANQDQAYIDYTILNLHRMRRLNKTFKPSEAILAKLNQIQMPQRWIVIAEAWCGDAAQNLPILNSFAKANKQIELQIILRDENPEIMDEYLTHGKRSIPKLIAVDKDDNVLFTWGPGPQTAQDMTKQHKLNQDQSSPEEFKLALHTWYTKNKGREVEQEFLSLL